MGTPRFEVPADINEVLFLLNAHHAQKISLIDSDGTVYGFFKTALQQTHMDNQGQIQVVEGIPGAMTALFTADTRQEAEAFVYGCFLTTFYGRSLKQIYNEVDRSRDEDQSHEDRV
jgi:hypothetical protein